LASFRQERLANYAPPVAGFARLVDPRISANAGGADISCSAGLVNPGIAMNITGLTRLVDSRIAANAGRTNIPDRPRLIDARVAIWAHRAGVPGRTRLVDSPVSGARGDRQGGDRRCDDQSNHPFPPQEIQSLVLRVASSFRFHDFLHRDVFGSDPGARYCVISLRIFVFAAW
jgi:hypothetical protein